jgi:hypothetical protein
VDVSSRIRIERGDARCELLDERNREISGVPCFGRESHEIEVLGDALLADPLGSGRWDHTGCRLCLRKRGLEVEHALDGSGRREDVGDSRGAEEWLEERHAEEWGAQMSKKTVSSGPCKWTFQIYVSGDPDHGTAIKVLRRASSTSLRIGSAAFTASSAK